MHRTREHTCIPAAEIIIRSTLPCRARKSLHSREHFFFVVFLACDHRWLFILWLIFFPLPLAFCQIASLWWRMGFMMAFLISVAQMRALGLPPCQERRRCSRHFIFFPFFNPCSRLLVSSQHCSVPLNVLTIKHGERVLYLCSVFAEYENVSMQYQSDELRRVDQRQCKYLGGF